MHIRSRSRNRARGGGSALDNELLTLAAFGASDAWDFVADQYIRAGTVSPSGLTVTRASSGYAETASGTLVNFGSGVLRRTDRGVLVEGARTNLLVRSQEFDDANWPKTNATVTANATTAPDGTTTADNLVEAVDVGSTHYVEQTVSKAASSITYAVSCFVKRASGTRNLEIRTDALSIANSVLCAFDLGAVTATVTASAGTFTGVSASITALANGWFRCVAIVTTGTETSVRMRATLLSGTSVGYNGDGTSGVFLWGAQLEAAAFASSYIPTVASTVTRAADVVTAVPTSGTDYPLSLFGEILRPVNPAAVACVVQTTDAGRTNRALLYVASNQVAREVSFSSGVLQTNEEAGSALGLNTPVKIAARFATNDVRLCANGTLSSGNTSATAPAAPTLIELGCHFASADFLNGYLRRAAILPRALTNAELQGITT
jgi:hypothetical protein